MSIQERGRGLETPGHVALERVRPWGARGQRFPLGAMELTEPERLVPVLLEVCCACHTWEDADESAHKLLIGAAGHSG